MLTHCWTKIACCCCWSFGNRQQEIENCNQMDRQWSFVIKPVAIRNQKEEKATFIFWVKSAVPVKKKKCFTLERRKRVMMVHWGMSPGVELHRKHWESISESFYIDFSSFSSSSNSLKLIRFILSGATGGEGGGGRERLADEEEVVKTTGTAIDRRAIKHKRQRQSTHIQVAAKAVDEEYKRFYTWSLFFFFFVVVVRPVCLSISPFFFPHCGSCAWKLSAVPSSNFAWGIGSGLSPVATKTHSKRFSLFYKCQFRELYRHKLWPVSLSRSACLPACKIWHGPQWGSGWEDKWRISHFVENAKKKREREYSMNTQCSKTRQKEVLQGCVGGQAIYNQSILSTP